MIYQLFGLLFGLAMVVHHVLFMVLLPALVERWLDDDERGQGCAIVEQPPLN